jgi:hypothetical protein
MQLQAHTLEILLYPPTASLLPFSEGGARQTSFKVMQSIARDEGVRYLFRGLLPRLLVVPSMMSWLYVLNEELEKRLLGTTKTVM